MAKSQATEIQQLAEQLFVETERTNSGIVWAELLEYIDNNSSTTGPGVGTSFSADLEDLATGTAGAKKTRRIYDGTAIRAADTLSSAIHGIMTNPASPWADLKFSGPTANLNEDTQSVIALNNSIKDIRRKISESNFSDEILKAYRSHVVLGNSALLSEVKPDGSYQFTALHMAHLAWTEGVDSRVDTVARKMILTGRQCLQRWGDNLPEKLLKKCNDKPLEKQEFIQLITPRDASKIILNAQGLSADPKTRPIAGYYIHPQSNSIIEETGFYDMPILGVRYNTMPGEAYGRGPGHIALPDVRTLNRFKQLRLEAETLQVRPPIIANQRDIFGGKLRLGPGQLTIVRSIEGIKRFDFGGETRGVEITVEQLQVAIEKAFHLDKLLLPDRTQTGEMSAYEVAERVKQMNTVLGPVLARLNNELLQPVILRLFRAELRRGSIEVTPAMQHFGTDIEVVFNNQLAQAQRIQEVTTINQWVQIVAGQAQLNPAVVDNVNFDAAARITGQTLGVPPEVIQDQAAIAQIRKERAEQQQAAMLAESAPGLADAANKIDEIGGRSQ